MSARAEPEIQPVVVFLAFAGAYFLSALLRAVTATLAPVFSAELGLQAADLGLLAGAYFVGFAALQLPLGSALDRLGPRRTQLALLAVAVLGCAAFALATDLEAMLAARCLIGAGVSACLMAPLTCYRRHFSNVAQLRANSWMLMTGSLGMLASTLPVQWLLPTLGWRGMFWCVGGLLLLAMAGLALFVPRDPIASDPASHTDGGYREILRHRLFLSMAPLGFVLYGGMIAVQALWAGPWLTRVSGWTPGEAAQGLFGINLAMLVSFLAWGFAMPRLARRGIHAIFLLKWGLPVSIGVLAANVVLGVGAQAGMWALWCVSCTFVAVSQPAIGAAFPAHLAGRALSAFNLVIFGGVFCVQWGIGLLVDTLLAAGLSDQDAFRMAMGLFGLGNLAAYAWFVCSMRKGADNVA